MDNIWELDKFILFLFFIIPGFIGLKVYELLIPSAKPDSSKQIIEAITYSCINYAILFVPILFIEKSKIIESYPFTYYIFYIFVFTGMPIILTILWKKIRESDMFQKLAPHPTLLPWDFIFSKREPYFIKAKLKNGDIIGGLYSENSFSSSSPAKEQIYLEQAWVMKTNGGFDRVKNDTKGIIIMQNQISYLEFKKYEEE